MRIAVWPTEPARSLAHALGDLVSDVVELTPWETAGALAADTCDLALVPTLEVLREPSAFSMAPNVALVGESSPEIVLVVGSKLDAVRTLGFDPRYAQEALLAAVLLREHYGAQPAFAPDDPAATVAERLAKHDAVLASRPAASLAPDGAIVLDLGVEWMDLTARPFVWGLLVARANELEPVEEARLAAAAHGADPPAGWQFTLGGYGEQGLEEFASHLFYHGALAGLPDMDRASKRPSAMGEGE